MIYTVGIFSIFAFIKTIGYAIYEYTDNSNKFAGIVCFILGLLSLVPIIIVLIK